MESQYKIRCLKLNELREIYKRLVFHKLNKGLIELKKEIYKIDSELKNIEASVGSFTTPHGNYKKALSNGKR